MEDDEEISSMVNESSVHEAEDSTMEEKLPRAEEFLNTEQYDVVPKLDDAKLLGTESPFVSKEGETAVDEEILMAGIKMETETETEASMSVGLQDSQLVGAEPPIPEKDDKDDESVEEEVITTADIKMEIRSPANVEAEEAKGEGELDSELHDSQIVGSESLIKAKDNENNETAVGEEIEAVDIKVEVELKAAVEAETAKGGGEELVPVGPESLTLGKDDGDDVMKYIPTVDAKMETETEAEAEVAKGGEGESVPELDDSQLVSAVSPIMAEDGEDQSLVVVEEALPVDAKMETESDVAEAMKVSSGKRRKGRNSKVSVRALAARKTIGEDVCFICFDGGDLFLCDRRGCPKGYHPSCVNRDEAFFLAKGRWNCGWHLCSKCEKNAYYMCYTCTFSLCKGCVKDAVILCVRGSKGFCETCMKTVMLIENNEQGNNEAQIDFDDKSSWEYLFKDYWIELKAKLSLSSVELAQAKNPYKGSDVLAGKQESPDDQFDVNDDGGSGPDNSSEKLVSSKSKKRKAKKRSKSLTKEQAMTSEAVAIGADAGSGSDDFSENLEASKSKKKKAKKRLKSLAKEQDITSEVVAVRAEGMSMAGNTEWGSKELLEFVMHMKDGDKTILSQFDVQAMLLEYIKRNKLRDPRRKSQIICDARLQNLFGKARVGHFEMLKLLESHFLIKEDSQIDDIQGSVVDTEVSQLDAAGNSEALTKGGKDRKRKLSKKGVWRGPQFNLDDYAAIDIHNINLIYLRRKLMEDLLEDSEKFHDNVAGTFVRIRISGSNQKQDIYRLVQVVGTSKAPKPYKIGRRTTDIMLDILNLNKTEVISIDTISNQEFTEDECKRLRQSIKCGLISRLTVGDILDKAMEIQSARVNDWLETEIVRLSHLRDRASENDRRKELRECVEKLHLLKTPEERQRRLEEIKEIHADPKMDPSYESEDDDSEMDDNKRELYTRPRGSAFSRRGREAISPGRGDFSPKDSWSGTRKNSGKNWELNRNLSNKNLSNKGEDATLSSEMPNDNSLNQGRDKETQHSNNLEKSGSATSSETIGWNSHSFVKSESFSGVVLEALPAASLSAPVAETASKISETEKMWRYKDPSGKVQGPFSMVQLRKWSNTGYFPVDLRIWRSTGEQVDSILLTDALAGRFPKEISPVDNGYPKASTPHSPHHASTHANKLYETSLQQGRGGQDGESLNLDQNRGAQISHGNLVPSSQSSGETLKSQQDLSSSRGWAAPSVEVPKLSTVTVGSDCGSRNNSVNLPSPTPKHSIAGWTGGEVGHLMGASSVPGSNEVMQSPAAAATESGKLARSSTSSTINPSGSIELNAMGSLGVLAPASLLDSSKQSTRVSGNDPSGFSVVPESEQGVLAGSTNSLQSSQPTVAGEPNGAQTHSHLLPAPETASNMGQSVNSQNPPFVTQGWVSAPPQNLEPNSSVHLPGQPQAYDQWGGVPSTVMNPPPNFATQGISVMPPSDPWRPPMQGNQLNMQPPVPPNTAWGTMPGNPNMVWGGPVPVNMSMNWGPIVQGPPPGNPNLGWVVPTGNVNQGWIAPPGNPPGAIVQGVAPGNANQAWVTPTGNLGANNVQGPLPGNGNPGWVQPSGNPGVNNVQGPPPGNANPGWGSPAGSRSMRGSEQNRRGERFSGQRDRGSQGGDSGFGGGRPWKRQTSFGSGGPGDSSRSLPSGQRLCEFHERGHCKKGSSCNFSHN